ncbi:MAG TPA: CRISPR-associated protein Cas4 [Firmicutes bacterium]|nr:CRISPR-associated protein Cas4 [Bacillota bacterium]
MRKNRDLHVTGTLVWYYYICPREVWLMGRQITPDEDDSNVELGRFIHEYRYGRDKKEINLGNIKLDIMRRDGKEIVIGEIKKSSHFIESAKMQLAFYLKELKQRGIEARGELFFPEEKRKERVDLTTELEEELNKVERDILRIIYADLPPAPEKNKWCRRCAYTEFCWS